jgi:hypothetical protein
VRGAVTSGVARRKTGDEGLSLLEKKLREKEGGGAVGQESRPFCRRAWTSSRSGPAQPSTMRLWRTLHRWPTRAWGAAEAAFE